MCTVILKEVIHHYINGNSSAYEKFQVTRAKVASVNLMYGSHFSATEAIDEVSHNVDFFVESLYLQEEEIDVTQSPSLFHRSLINN